MADQDKFWIAHQLVGAFLKLHGLRAFHGDFGSGKVFLTSGYKVLIGDFAPIKPFCLQSKTQNPIEFHQIWFDEGLDGETDEIGRGCYLAPERLKFNTVENFEASDLFSLGCTLVELFGTRAFLQFKDVLALSRHHLDSSEEYDALLGELIVKADFAHFDILPIVKRLCARDPLDRKLFDSDLEVIRSKIDPEIANWRKLLSSYRLTNDFCTRKEIISRFPDDSISHDFDNLLLVCLKEKDPILSVLLVNFILKAVQGAESRSELLKTFHVNFVSGGFKFVNNLLKEFSMVSSQNCSSINEFPLIQAFNSGLRGDNLLKLIGESDNLREVLDLAARRQLAGEKLMAVLNKLSQIYRKREVFDADFEARITFEYLRIGADEEDLKLLFKTCWKFYEKYSKKEAISSSRIAFRLDLEKNKVPIESCRKATSKSSWFMKRTDSHSHSRSRASQSQLQAQTVYPKLKQRLVNEPIKWTEPIAGILQSPDKSFIIGYTEATLHFWDMKRIIRSQGGEPLASVNPRTDAIITSVIFGKDSDSLIISFKDGIIGLYK